MPALGQHLAVNAAVHIVDHADVTGRDTLQTDNRANQAEDHDQRQNNRANFTFHSMNHPHIPYIFWAHRPRFLSLHH